MKIKKILIVMMTALLSLGSCQNENDLTVDDGKQTEGIYFSPEEFRLLTEVANKTSKITEEEAMSKALDAMNSISTTFTKSGRTRTVKNSQALTISKNIGTKSSGESFIPDTVAYIFNFDNEEGYIIVAADERVPEKILACVEEGSLGSETDNPGLAIFLERAEDYITESIEKAEAKKDSLAREILYKLIAESPELADEISTKAIKMEDPTIYDLYNIDTSVSYTTTEWSSASLAPLTAVEWNQPAPYNKFTKAKGCNGNAPNTGCVAVATAQILAYWKYPSSIDGYNMNWTEMTRYTSDFNRNNLFNYRWTGSVFSSNTPTDVVDNIARLMERIGDHVDMDYGCSGSSANSDKAVDWLQKIGFSGGEKSNYDFSRVKSSLDSKRIVYGRGYSTRVDEKFLGITYNTYYKGGHAWNYDGYIQKTQKVERTVTVRDWSKGKIISQSTSVEYTYRDLVHVNWGWGGNHNGYYLSGVFDANGDRMPSGTRSSSDYGTDYNYQYKLEIYTNLRR
jgi:Peptidase C10 family.